MMCTKYICFLIYFSRAGRFLNFKMLQCVQLRKTLSEIFFFLLKMTNSFNWTIQKQGNLHEVKILSIQNDLLWISWLLHLLTQKLPFIYTDKTVVCMLVMLAIHALAHIPITCHVACQQQSMALPLIFTILQNVTFLLYLQHYTL